MPGNELSGAGTGWGSRVLSISERQSRPRSASESYLASRLAEPGSFETVKQLLGHKSLKTTVGPMPASTAGALPVITSGSSRRIAASGFCCRWTMMDWLP